MINDSEVRQAVNVAVANGTLVWETLLGEQPSLMALPSAVRDRFLLGGVLTWLLANGYLLPGPAVATADLGADMWQPLGLPEPHATEFATAVTEAVARQERVQAFLRRVDEAGR